MTKRFIVLHGETTHQQDEGFINWLRAGGAGWWRWMDGSWLIDSDAETHNAQSIRDKLTEIYPTVSTMVIELRPDGTDTWAGYGTSTAKKNMFKWLHQNWKQS